MAQEYEKRFYTLDGKTRITIYREEYPESPRDMTDEPFHCEDWSRDCSIMNKKEQEYKVSSARIRIERLAGEFGDYKKIIDTLVENGKNIGNKKVTCGTALVYDKSRKAWVLLGDINCYFGSKREDGWYEYNVLDGKKYDLDIYAITEDATDDAIDYLATNCMTDQIKMMSYGFGYYGDISFYHDFSTDSEGICWLEKDEFLKYSGNDEEYWNGKSLDEIEFLLDELKSWGDGDVYGFVVEDAVRIQGIKTYYNGEREDEPYIDTQWEESDSCCGYYGELEKVEGWVFEENGLNKEDFEEENV
jgi:hypothetical protein